MPYYLEFNSQGQAVSRTRQEAIDRGVRPDAGTKWWWPVFETSTGLFVIPVDPDTPDAILRDEDFYEFVNRIV